MSERALSPALRRALAWVLPLGVLVLLHVAASREGAPRYAVSPVQVAMTWWELARSGELWADVGASLRRSFAGFAIGATLGVGLGLLCSVVRPLRAFFDPLVSMAYPVPKVALLPVLITWLGFGDASKVAMIALAVFFPTFINALYGARSVHPRWIWSARNMGASQSQCFFRVVVPASLPHVFNGLRSGLALSFVVLFAAEMVGARNGLGNLIIKAEEGMRFDLMYAAVFTIGVLGFAFDRLLLAMRRRLLARKFSGEDGNHG
jgi:ABC-type nitrate/sulfonate/bicarbonate transport system permease component